MHAPAGLIVLESNERASHTQLDPVVALGVLEEDALRAVLRDGEQVVTLRDRVVGSEVEVDEGLAV